ncbi:MAG: hypothetical protein KGD64_10675 [Candidatus Heimdallarchaeota archaeon]|nr:hypothetical protein [Candidatus Heimdallarchaeota archaeon]
MKQNEITKLLDSEFRRIYEDLEEITLALTGKLSSYKKYDNPFLLPSSFEDFWKSNLQRSNKLR